MSIEKINISGIEETPLGRVVSYKKENGPEEDNPEEPEMPEEEPQVEEIVPDPPKEKDAPPPLPDKGWLRKIWEKKKPGADKPN